MDAAASVISSGYVIGSLSCSDKDWFHGELTREKAEQALAASGCDCFLIRQSQGALVLSLIQHGEPHHIKIEYGPGWYKLEGAESHQTFRELQELVSHYCRNPISDDFDTLGPAACKQPITTTHEGIFSNNHDIQVHVTGVDYTA